jgi:hypothetical protein
MEVQPMIAFKWPTCKKKGRHCGETVDVAMRAAEEAQREATRLFSYVVDHDHGFAPHPFGGYCSLVECKHGSGRFKNIVELAEEGDWVVGTGGVKRVESAGHGKIIYAMRVDQKICLGKYYADARFKERIDAHGRSPKKGRFALVSRHFFYYGRNAIDIPSRYLAHPLEKKGPGFRSDFDQEFIDNFTTWLETTYRLGVHGQPCDPMPELGTPKCAYKVREK